MSNAGSLTFVPLLPQEEFEAVMLPRHSAQRGLVRRREGSDARGPSGELPYERRAPKGRIPTAVDWRGTGADGVVKDQVGRCFGGYPRGLHAWHCSWPVDCGVAGEAGAAAGTASGSLSLLHAALTADGNGRRIPLTVRDLPTAGHVWVMLGVWHHSRSPERLLDGYW